MSIYIKTPYLQDVVEIIDKDDPHTIEVHGKVYKQVVRCKDCKLFDPEHEGGVGSCGLDMNVTANDYCSKAERKESEKNG